MVYEKRFGTVSFFILSLKGNMDSIKVQEENLEEISRLFDQLEILLQNQLEAQGITLRKELNPDELILFGDQHQIEQVLINLLQNAIQALEDAEEKIITLSAFIDEAGKIIIEVTDTGKGIEEEALSKIFIPFFKGLAQYKCSNNNCNPNNN